MPSFTPAPCARSTDGIASVPVAAAATPSAVVARNLRRLIPFSRRKFLATTALGVAAAATGTLAMPSVLRAQGAGVKLGILHPVSGALSYSGTQGRLGATPVSYTHLRAH